MELLVCNKIVSLDLPVKEVFKKIWCAHSNVSIYTIYMCVSCVVFVVCVHARMCVLVCWCVGNDCTCTYVKAFPKHLCRGSL